MFKKDVELFVLEKRKNNILRKEWEETAKKGNNLKENEQEFFLTKNYLQLLKNMVLIFHTTIFANIKNITQPLIIMKN